MPARKPRPKDERPQFERFVETARNVGADETDEALETAIKKISLERRPAKAPRQRDAAKKRAT
jgi:hypothetical protein